MKAILIVLAIGLVSSFPLYKQCDSRWGSNKLGSSTTICKSGCLMSSVAMYSGTHTPGTLNSWLMGHGGYSGNLFIWGSVSSLGLKYLGKSSSAADITNHINAGHGVILNVHNGGHWVLATGVSGSSYLVNDPGYTTTSYPKSEVREAGIFSKSGRFVDPELLKNLEMVEFEDLSNFDIETEQVSQ